MADGELSRPLSPRLHADPRHARRTRLRFAVGHADEGHRPDGLDDRPPLRDRLRKARAQQAALETDHRPFRAAEAQRAAAEFVLRQSPLSSPRTRGPIHSVICDEESVGRKRFAKNSHRWLWVPAFAGTTSALNRLLN